MSERTHGWCPTCREESAVDRDGRCLWCDTPTRVRRKRGGWKRPDLRGSRYTEPQLRAMHVAHMRGDSLNSLAKRTFHQVGYTNRNSAVQAISRQWKRMGLPVRGRIESCVRVSTKHGRKSRNISNAEQIAYRRWLRDQRGWRAVQGPGQPQCKGVRRQHPRKGEPCQRPAQEGSDYCSSHDPRRELARQAHLVKVRARQPERRMVPLAPFSRWLERRHDELGTWKAVAEAACLSLSSVRNYSLGIDGFKRPKYEVGADVVERVLEADGTAYLEELYPEALPEAA